MHPIRDIIDAQYTEKVILGNKEKVVHLDDLILRRSLMAYLGHLNRPLIDELAGVLAEVLEWNSEQKSRSGECA